MRAVVDFLGAASGAATLSVRPLVDARPAMLRCRSHRIPTAWYAGRIRRLTAKGFAMLLIAVAMIQIATQIRQPARQASPA